MAENEYKITDHPLSVDEAYRRVVRQECGAVCLFVGTVRNSNEGKEVKAIDYSAFREMAEKEFSRIAEEGSRRWKLGSWYIAHRVGKLLPTEASVVIAVSSPHRAESFDACRFAIEELKKLAPIWKEEFYESDRAWISGS